MEQETEIHEQVAEYGHYVHIYFTGGAYLRYDIKCSVYTDEQFFYDDFKDSFLKKEYKKHSYNFLCETLNRNVHNICAALSNPSSDLYSDSVNLYKKGPYIFRYSLFNDNILFVNSQNVAYITVGVNKP